MGKIVRNLFDTAFDPETVKALCDAYDRACTSLHDRGQPDIVNEVIAERIISLAKKGERDPDKLCEGALVALSGTPFFPRWRPLVTMQGTTAIFQRSRRTSIVAIWLPRCWVRRSRQAGATSEQTKHCPCE